MKHIDLCLLILIISLFFIPIVSSAATIYVPKDERTIADAINKANAGDTIYLNEGLYYENLLILKNITIIGPQFLQVDRDGNNLSKINNIQLPTLSSSQGNTPYIPYEHAAIIIPQNEPAINITSASVTIKNLFIISRDTCVQVTNSSDVDIERNFFYSCDTGFSGVGSNLIQISQNVFESQKKSGIKLENVLQAKILNNTFENGGVGISVRNAQQCTIGENLFHDIGIGVNSNGFSDALIRKNEIRNCTFGSLFLSVRNITVVGNHVQNITQYLLFFNSVSNTIYIDESCGMGVFSKDLQSSNQYISSNFTLTGKNFLFSCLPGKRYTGYRYFGDRIDTALINISPYEQSWINLDATTNPQLIDDIDPFTFGFYSTNGNMPIIIGRTYVSGNTVKTSARINDTPFGVYALLGKRKIPFGLTIEGITFIFLIIAALIALLIYRHRHTFGR